MRSEGNSLDNEDYLFDVPFVAEEVDSVLKKLKLGKTTGHDVLKAEHLKYGGPTLGLDPADLQCNRKNGKHTHITQDQNHNTSIQRRWE